MMHSRKILIFYLILISIVVVSLEVSARLAYFVKYKRISHVLSEDEVKRLDIRKIVPYHRKGDVRPSIARKFIDKNGYYVISRNSRTFGEGPKVYINRLGFRGKEIDETDEERIRVLCLGGSTTFGYLCSMSYPEILEELLNKDRPRYMVLNGGIPGANAQHIYNMLRDKKFMTRLDPDILVVNTAWNTLGQYDNGFLIEAADNASIEKILRNSALGFFVYRIIIAIKCGEFLGPYQSMYLYLDKICRWAEKEGVKVLFFNEPMVLDEKAWKAVAEQPKNYEHTTAVLRRFSDKYPGTVFYCPMPFFESITKDSAKAKRYFIDQGHRNEEGMAIEAGIIAESIGKLVSEYGLVRRPAPN